MFLFDNVIDAEIMDALLTSGSSSSEAISLYLKDIGYVDPLKGSKTIPAVNAVWSSVNLMNDGAKCIEGENLNSQDCVAASLDIASLALTAAVVLGAGVASTPLIVALGTGVAGLQLINQMIKWE